MKNTYYDLVAQTFDFPQDDFRLKANRLLFNDIDIHKFVDDKVGIPTLKDIQKKMFKTLKHPFDCKSDENKEEVIK